MKIAQIEEDCADAEHEFAGRGVPLHWQRVRILLTAYRAQAEQIARLEKEVERLRLKRSLNI